LREKKVPERISHIISLNCPNCTNTLHLVLAGETKAVGATVFNFSRENGHLKLEVKFPCHKNLATFSKIFEKYCVGHTNMFVIESANLQSDFHWKK
jgi:hypothetical protein